MRRKLGRPSGTRKSIKSIMPASCAIISWCGSLGCVCTMQPDDWSMTLRIMLPGTDSGEYFSLSSLRAIFLGWRVKSRM